MAHSTQLLQVEARSGSTGPALFDSSEKFRIFYQVEARSGSTGPSRDFEEREGKGAVGSNALKGASKGASKGGHWFRSQWVPALFDSGQAPPTDNAQTRAIRRPFAQTLNNRA